MVLEESDNLSSDESYADTIAIKLKTSNFLSYGFLMSIKNNIFFGFNYREPVYTMEANKLRYIIHTYIIIYGICKVHQFI